MKDIESKTLNELRKYCRDNKIKDYSSKKKLQLIQLINNFNKKENVIVENIIIGEDVNKDENKDENKAGINIRNDLSRTGINIKNRLITDSNSLQSNIIFKIIIGIVLVTIIFIIISKLLLS